MCLSWAGWKNAFMSCPLYVDSTSMGIVTVWSEAEPSTLQSEIQHSLWKTYTSNANIYNHSQLHLLSGAVHDSKGVEMIESKLLNKLTGYIGGRWTDNAHGNTFDVYNPATGKVIAS